MKLVCDLKFKIKKTYHEIWNLIFLYFIISFNLKWYLKKNWDEFHKENSHNVSRKISDKITGLYMCSLKVILQDLKMHFFHSLAFCNKPYETTYLLICSVLLR